MKKSFIKILFIVMILFFSASPFKVLADEVKDNDKNVYCALCTKSEDDPLYKKERQFYEKIKIIKTIFGDRIDEVALAATVLHKYGVDNAYNVEYTEDFDSNTYTATWNGISSSQNQNSSDLFTDDNAKVKVSKEQKNMIEANEKVDLLTLAAIVMVDSNNGQYSDVCYKEALAGDALVGNTKDEDLLSRFENGIFCGALEVVPTPLDFIANMFSGDGFLVSGISTANRIVNTDKVCKNGYVGGLYQNITKMKKGSQKEALKKKTAQDIIDYANYYKRLYGTLEEENNSCTVNIAGSTGAFASWKQADSNWKSISLGGSSSVGNAGCLVTSISMQIARSGTKIGKLPSGYSEFNPGAFVTSLNNNGGFAGGGNFGWTGFSKIAPNWGVGDFVSLGTGDNKTLADAVTKELSSGFGSENYQKFLVLQIHHAKSSQHWVAVNGVENGKVTIFDPGGPSGTTLDENYTGWVVDGYRIMYAKDVTFGQTGTTINNTCTGNVVSSGKGQGNIKIPEEYGAGGYTVTVIEEFNWGYDSGKIYDKWVASGAQYSNGIAVLNGRYLIACTTTFGKVGDEIDFFLDDGTKIPTIMMDEKSQVSVAWDRDPANKWGHDNGANVLEFEVDGYYFYDKYKRANPGSGANDWYREWAGKRVASATNLTNSGIKSETVSSTSGVSTTSGVSGGQAIAELAMKYAPIDGHISSNGPHTKVDDPRLADWYSFVEKTHSQLKWNSPYWYASCTPDVLYIIYGALNQKYDHLDTKTDGWDTQFLDHPDLWEEITYKKGDKWDDVCKPGDIIFRYGHGAIYVGHDLVKQKFPKSKGNVWESGEYTKRYPGISNYSGEISKEWRIIRSKVNAQSETGDLVCVDGNPSSTPKNSSGNFDYEHALKVYYNQGEWPYDYGGWGTCGPTAMVMLIDILNNTDVTPYEYFDSRKAAGVWYSGHGDDPGLSDFHKKKYGIKCEKIPRTIDAIKEALSEGKVVWTGSENTTANGRKLRPWLVNDNSKGIPSYGKTKTEGYQHETWHQAIIWAYENGYYLMKHSGSVGPVANNVPYSDEDLQKWLDSSYGAKGGDYAGGSLRRRDLNYACWKE